MFIVLGVLLGYVFGLEKESRTVNIEHKTLGYHKSYFSTPSFFDQAFAAVGIKKIQPKPGIAGLVVNHHLLAAPFIAETLEEAATNESVTVILISPNHFDAGPSNIETSVYDWQTPYGILPANQNFATHLPSARVQEFPFEKEHGISGVIPFIKRTMPNATLVPIILKDKTTSEEIDKLEKEIAQQATGPILMVASIDFSHYLPSAVANFHDILSEHVLRTFDYNNIKNLEIDSRPSMRLLLKYMETRDTEHFTVLNHSNSQELTNKLDDPSGTSYITGYFTKGPRILDTHNTTFITGSIYNQNKNILSQVERMFSGSSQTYILDQTLFPFDISKTPSAHGIVYLAGEDKKNAHKIIDDGADMVIEQGSSPGQIEVYKNRLIISSLGDLVPQQGNNKSWALGIDQNSQGVSYYLFGLQYNNGQVTFLRPTQNVILEKTNNYHFDY